MARVIVGMVMPLDGFDSNRNGDLGLLYPDMEAMRGSEVVQEAIRSTGRWGGAPIDMKSLGVSESPGVTHLRYRIGA